MTQHHAVDYGISGSFGFGSVPRQTQRQPRVARRSHAARYGCACLRSLEWRHAHGRTARLVIARRSHELS